MNTLIKSRCVLQMTIYVRKNLNKYISRYLLISPFYVFTNTANLARFPKNFEETKQLINPLHFNLKASLHKKSTSLGLNERQ